MINVPYVLLMLFLSTDTTVPYVCVPTVIVINRPFISRFSITTVSENRKHFETGWLRLADRTNGAETGQV